MKLSKFTLNMQHPSVRQCLRDCHDMHRTIMSAFGTGLEEQPRAQAKILYRIMPSRNGSSTVYLASSSSPNSGSLSKKGFEFTGTRDLEPLKEILVDGSRWRFDLQAVPSKKVPVEGGNSRRTFLKTADERAEWLIRKGEQNGFRILCYEERGQQKTVGSRNGKKFVFTSMQFSGMLEVIDLELFWRGYLNGVGPEKAYGMGMLLLSVL